MSLAKTRILQVLLAAALCGIVLMLVTNRHPSPAVAKSSLGKTPPPSAARHLSRSAPLPWDAAGRPDQTNLPFAGSDPLDLNGSAGQSDMVASSNWDELVRANTRPGKAPPQDPIARELLAFVGADPEAEAYWIDAINDASLPAEERQDLIEDLNEDGLPDPKNPTPSDLPLILNRIQLLEAISADPMDNVNAEAFAEAYKDLLNLADIVLGRGEPVR